MHKTLEIKTLDPSLWSELTITSLHLPHNFYEDFKKIIRKFSEQKKDELSIQDPDHVFFHGVCHQLNLLSARPSGTSQDIMRLLFLLIIIKDRNETYHRQLAGLTQHIITPEKEDTIRSCYQIKTFLYTNLKEALDNANYNNPYAVVVIERAASVVSQMTVAGTQKAYAAACQTGNALYFAGSALSATLWNTLAPRSEKSQSEESEESESEEPLQMTDGPNNSSRRPK